MQIALEPRGLYIQFNNKFNEQAMLPTLMGRLVTGGGSGQLVGFE